MCVFSAIKRNLSFFLCCRHNTRFGTLHFNDVAISDIVVFGCFF